MSDNINITKDPVYQVVLNLDKERFFKIGLVISNKLA